MPAPVQTGTVAGAYNRAVTASLATAPAVGNTVFGIGSCKTDTDPGPTSVSISDNQGGVDADYEQQFLDSLQRSGVFFVRRLITAPVVGTFQMEADIGAGFASPNMRLQLVELEGEFSFAAESTDGSGQFDGGSATVNLTASSANPDGELIAFAAMTPRADGEFASVATNPPTGYTTLESRFFEPAPLVSAYKSISAPETTTANFGAVAWNSGRLAAKVVTYLRLGDGGGTVALAAQASATATAVAQLAVAKALQSSGSAVGSASAAVLKDVRLVSAAVAVAGASASMSRGVSLLASGVAVGAAGAQMALSVQLQASGIARALASAGVNVSKLLAADGSADANATASLQVLTQADLAAAGTAQASATAVLSLTVRLASSAVAQATAGAGLQVGGVINLAAAGAAQADASALLQLEVPLSSHAIAQALAGGSLLLTVPLAASAFAVATSTAEFAPRVQMSAQGHAIASASALLQVVGAFARAPAGSGYRRAFTNTTRPRTSNTGRPRR